MAQKVTVVDDLDGSAAAEVVEFGLDGKYYEIDLSETNAAKLRDSLAVFVAHARRAGKGRKPERRRHPDEVREIRQWVRENDPQVSLYGRIPNKFLEAWDRGQDRSVFKD